MCYLDVNFLNEGIVLQVAFFFGGNFYFNLYMHGGISLLKVSIRFISCQFGLLTTLLLLCCELSDSVDTAEFIPLYLTPYRCFLVQKKNVGENT